MNQFDVAAILMNYSIKCTKAEDNEQLKSILKELHKRFDENQLKEIKIEKEKIKH